VSKSSIRTATLLLTTLWVATLAGVSFSAEIVVQTARGEATVTSHPQRIATLDLNVIENLHALGVEIAGVPQNALPDFLSSVTNSNPARIGTVFEADVEAIKALQPDLIIVASRSRGQLETVSELAPAIDLTPDTDNYVRSALQNLNTLGAIVGEEDKAKVLSEEMLAAINSLKSRFADSGRSLIVLTNAENVMPVVPTSRQGWPYAELGLTPALEDIELRENGRPAPITSEYILEVNPDWIFVVDRSAAINAEGVRAKEVLTNDFIAGTNAAKAGQIVYLDPYVWYLAGNGILSLQNAVHQFNGVLDGE